MRALVVAGGGMRGAFASGVAHAIDEMGLRFDAVYGTSVGGAVAAWLTAGQAEDGLRTWDAAQDRAVLNYTRWLTGRGPLLDLQHLYGELYFDEFGLDVDRIRKATRPAYVTVTDVETGLGRLVDLRRTDIPTALMATSAMPLATDGPFNVDGRPCLDGGLADPLPIRRAIADGARSIVAVVNHSEDHRPRSPRMLAWYLGRRWPAVGEAVEEHEGLYAEEESVARAPPDGVEITMIRPASRLPLHRFTRDLDKLQTAIGSGQERARKALT